MLFCKYIAHCNDCLRHLLFVCLDLRTAKQCESEGANDQGVYTCSFLLDQEYLYFNLVFILYVNNV